MKLLIGDVSRRPLASILNAFGMKKFRREAMFSQARSCTPGRSPACQGVQLSVQILRIPGDLATSELSKKRLAGSLGFLYTSPPFGVSVVCEGFVEIFGLGSEPQGTRTRSRESSIAVVTGFANIMAVEHVNGTVRMESVLGCSRVQAAESAQGLWRFSASSHEVNKQKRMWLHGPACVALGRTRGDDWQRTA